MSDMKSALITAVVAFAVGGGQSWLRWEHPSQTSLLIGGTETEYESRQPWDGCCA